MTDQDNGTDDFVIKIPASMLGQHQETKDPEKPKSVYDYHFFTRTNINPVRVKRNSEHGLTDVQSLAFAEQDQRQKVLSLLHTPALYDTLPNLLTYIFRLGCDQEVEKRYYAALAIGQLANKLPFLDLKQHVILRWAKIRESNIQLTASIALSYMIEQELYKSDVLMLIRHWVSNPNPALKNTALLTYYWLAQSYPNETLEAIKVILSKQKILDYPKVIELFGVTYDLDPAHAVEHLYDWLMQNKNPMLCWMAGLLFFSIVRLEDVVEDETLRQKVVEMIVILWDDPKMPMQQEMQEQTTVKVERWARQAVAVYDQESPETFETYQALFRALHQKYKGQRRNYLEDHFKRLQKYRDWEQARTVRQGRDVGDGKKQQVSFLDLIA